MKSKVRVSVELLLLFSLTLLVVFVQEDPNRIFGTSGGEVEKADFGVRASLGEIPQEKREFTENNPDLYFKGATLVPQAGSATVQLVGMNGELLKKWDFDAQRVRLLPNCNLLVLHGSKWGIKREPWRGLRDRVREYSWDGKLLWEHRAPNVAHHDLARLDNSNTIFIHRVAVPSQFKKHSRDPIRKRARIRTDRIVEINREGEEVWSWSYFDQFPIDHCGKSECEPLPSYYGDGKKFVDWTHTNTVSPLPENKWYDQGDKRFRPGNLLVLPRNWSTVLLVDKESKEVVWSYSGEYEGGLGGGHEANMISKGLPGEGNILIFDNGRESHSGRSFILEVNPTTDNIEWLYNAGDSFFSHAAGSVQRLPNGNTLISEDVSGRIFEVLPSKEIVWQYQSDIRTCRAQRYPFNYCEELSKFE